jgi:hypothetical protein
MNTTLFDNPGKLAKSGQDLPPRRLRARHPRLRNLRGATTPAASRQRLRWAGSKSEANRKQIGSKSEANRKHFGSISEAKRKRFGSAKPNIPRRKRTIQLPLQKKIPGAGNECTNGEFGEPAPRHAPTKAARAQPLPARSLRGALEKNNVFCTSRSAAFVGPRANRNINRHP